MSVEDVGGRAAPALELPRRPAAVPPEAEWSERTHEWELTPRDADGRPHGLVRVWRQDGSLASEYDYRAGERDGTFRRYHPDGTLARAGAFLAGRQHGRTIAHGYDGPGMTPEPLQSCCVPPGAWRLQHDFDHGNLAEALWFDRAGVHILPTSGKPFPVRPASVPREATFQERRDLWVHEPFGEAKPEGVWRRWSREGLPHEREEYHAGKAHGLWQRFDASGALTDETHWVDGVRSGPYRRIGVPSDLYADARVHEERGAFDRDQAVGTWTLLDAAGEVLHTRTLGAALDAEVLLTSTALAHTTPTLAVAAALEKAEGRIAEALLATARAAAAAGDATPLQAALQRLAMPLTAPSARAKADQLTKSADGRLDLLANGLPAGVDAVSVLRALASSISGRDLVALDLVNAALLLAPDRDDCRVTRALLYIYLGRPDAARTEAASLPASFEEQRTFIDGYARVTFPAFPFVPGEAEIHTAFPDVPEAPDQPLENVRAQLQRYATRLGVVRAELLTRLPPGAQPAWLPPDVSRLLPDGPVELTTWDFEEIIEDEDAPADAPPPEAKLVTVDERIVVDAATPLPTLMRSARRDWVGLCWMSWAVGLSRVDLPDTVEPPADFGAAAGMSIERLWRCRDRLITGGLRAMTQGVPGFRWEGFEIELAPSALVEIAADEFREMRAVFYWLCDEGVQSPWQSNVRLPD